MNKIYDESSIDVLEGLEPVRLRPSMYIGNVDVAGLHHLVYEVVDNSIDEAMAGFCKNINITVHSDNSISVEDDGRGIPVGIHKTENVPAVEVVLTKLHAGGKFDNESYKVSGGLHGVGVSVVNALSAFLEVEVYSDKKVYYQTYERGIKTSELKEIGKTKKKGTKIHFIPDEDIFNNVDFNYDLLNRRLRELAFLNKGIKITINDERSDKQDEFLYTGALPKAWLMRSASASACTVLAEIRLVVSFTTVAAVGDSSGTILAELASRNGVRRAMSGAGPPA